LVLSFLLQLSS